MTQMESARKGILTNEMKTVASKEHISEDKLMQLIAEGKVIIPCNRLHKCISPNGVGSALTTKINVNLGTSRDMASLEEEMKKVQKAVDLGAEAIMDLSSYAGI